MYNDTLFFVGSDNAIHAYDVTDIRNRPPRELWIYQLPEATDIQPVSVGGSLVVVTRSGHVVVLDVRKKGAFVLRWKQKLNGDIYAKPTFSQTNVLVGSFDKNLYALNMSEGKLAWKFETPGKIRGIAVAGGVIYGTCDEGIVFAINEK